MPDEKSTGWVLVAEEEFGFRLVRARPSTPPELVHATRKDAHEAAVRAIVGYRSMIRRALSRHQRAVLYEKSKLQRPGGAGEA